MKLIALLSWYDESPSWLAACVASLAFCDHLVAVDGAYALYPEAQPWSPSGQTDVIVETARGAGLGLTLHRPSEVWMGNEVEKRNRMFDLARCSAKLGHDWFLIVDADEVVTSVPSDLRDVLERTEHDTATYQLWQKEDWLDSPAKAEAATWGLPSTSQSVIRGMYRASKRLRLEATHFRYTNESGTLWHPGETHPPAEPTDLKVEHRVGLRDKGRANSQAAYYRLRDELGAETPA